MLPRNTSTRAQWTVYSLSRCRYKCRAQRNERMKMKGTGKKKREAGMNSGRPQACNRQPVRMFGVKTLTRSIGTTSHEQISRFQSLNESWQGRDRTISVIFFVFLLSRKSSRARGWYANKGWRRCFHAASGACTLFVLLLVRDVVYTLRNEVGFSSMHDQFLSNQLAERSLPAARWLIFAKPIVAKAVSHKRAGFSHF